MNMPLRTTLAAGSVLALIAVVLSANPALAAEAGLDFWNIPVLRSNIDASEKEFAELERKGDVVINRSALRAETVDGVIEGRIEPEAAVQEFVRLNRTDGAMLSQVRYLYDGDTDEQRAALQLVAHVRAHPNPRAAALADEIGCRLLYPESVAH